MSISSARMRRAAASSVMRGDRHVVVEGGDDPRPDVAAVVRARRSSRRPRRRRGRGAPAPRRSGSSWHAGRSRWRGSRSGCGCGRRSPPAAPGAPAPAGTLRAIQAALTAVCRAGSSWSASAPSGPQCRRSSRGRQPGERRVDHRPERHALAQVDVVLLEVRLVGVDQERRAHLGAAPRRARRAPRAAGRGGCAGGCAARRRRQAAAPGARAPRPARPCASSARPRLTAASCEVRPERQRLAGTRPPPPLGAPRRISVDAEVEPGGEGLGRREPWDSSHRA